MVLPYINMNLPWVFLKYRNTIDFCVLKINYCLNFPGGSDGKSVCLHCGRPGFNPQVGKIPWRRKWQPTPVPLPGKFHGQRSHVGYSTWNWQRVFYIVFCTSNFKEALKTHTQNFIPMLFRQLHNIFL